MVHSVNNLPDNEHPAFPVLPSLPEQASEVAQKVLDDLAVSRPPKPQEPVVNLPDQAEEHRSSGRRGLRNIGNYI